jgi:hypothetical protein
MRTYILTSLIAVSGLSVSPVSAHGNAVTNDAGEVFIRDPFTPSRMMYEQAGTRSNIDSELFGFRPSDNPDIKIPKMRLRGFVTPEGTEEMLALLEIAGSGVFMVREGDEINIDPRQPATAIRIADINRLSVTIETGTLGRIRVLR